MELSRDEPEPKIFKCFQEKEEILYIRVDPEVEAICDSVKGEVEERTGEKYDTFKASSVRTQDVDGTNFFITVHVGGGKNLDIFVIKRRSGQLILQSVQEL